MRRFGAGVLVGILLAAALAWAATAKEIREQPGLHVWDGDGARIGLYYTTRPYKDKPGVYHFYECRPIGPAQVTPPAK